MKSRVELRAIRSSRWLVAFCVVLASLSVGPVARAQEQAGFVLDKSGEWFLDKNRTQRVSEADKLPAGAAIWPATSNPLGSYITIALYTGEAKTYHEWARLPRRVEPSLYDRIWAVVRDRYNSGTVHAVSRGDSLQDAIVKFKEEKIDLGPVFKNVRRGSYDLRFRPITRDGRPASTEATRITFNWQPESASPISLDGLKPGLYKLSLWDAHTSEPEPLGIDAWILISRAEEYDKAVSSYQDAVRLTRKWDKKVKPDAAQRFLRAYLEFLADQSDK